MVATSRFKPRIRNTSETSIQKEKKLELIDKFIELNPKIPQINKDATIIKEAIIEDKPI
jgi:hypothetical protein